MAGLSASAARFLRSKGNRGETGAGSSRNREPAEQTADSEQAARALALAGAALDPNAPGGPSLALGQLLLREAFVAVARALCNDTSIDRVEAATAGLERLGRPASHAVVALGQAAVADNEALARAQSDVAQLVDQATAKRRMPGAMWRGLLAFGLVAGAVATVARIASPPPPQTWEDYAWHASSAWNGFVQSGTLAHRGRHDLLLHTGEEDDPWVVVDLGAVRIVHDVRVINRADCCQDRGLPLVLEVATEEDGPFTPVETRTEPFDAWRVTFPPRKARYVRLRAIGRTILNLSEIQIR